MKIELLTPRGRRSVEQYDKAVITRVAVVLYRVGSEARWLNWEQVAQVKITGDGLLFDVNERGEV